MFLLPFVGGALSVLSPFFGLLMMMIFSAKALGPAIVSPQRAIISFMVVPAFVLLFGGNSYVTPLLVLDAIIGVAAVVYIFLIVLRKYQFLNQAFLAAAVLIMLYSVARMMLFSSVLEQSFNEGMTAMQAQMPALFDGPYMDLSYKLWKLLQPAFWGVGQIFALLIGYLAFHRIIKIPLESANVKFPVVYNSLILAILPLYFWEAGKAVFINALILLCMIPLIQGFFSVWAGISKVFANNIIKGIIMFILLIYAFIPLTLIGFADSWMSHSNKPRGGKTA